MNFVADMDIGDGELEDIDDLGNENELHFNDGLADNEGIADTEFNTTMKMNTTILVVLIKMKNNRTIFWWSWSR